MSHAEPFRADEQAALDLDATDPLGGFRGRFHVPRAEDGRDAVYLSGHSLGLQPRAAADAVQAELDSWARHGVDGHFHGRHPWFSYHEPFREPLARLVGAEPTEVVAMNSLTVNLHLMMVSFFRPTPRRHRVLIERAAFPSDLYAARSQLRFHGFDPETGLIEAGAEGSFATSDDDVEAVLDRHGSEIALVLLGGVNYFTGRRFDMRRVAGAARRAGAAVGLDLAHAAGNVPLELHDWNVDFAVWCSYKYLNAGPGAVAGCFVHERHLRSDTVPRFAGWWGNDPDTRFRMHLEREFVPVPSADGWQLSNPPILALAPLRVSLGLFDAAGMDALHAKARRLHDYLRSWCRHAAGDRLELLTPPDDVSHGCQLSLRVVERPRVLFEALRRNGVVADFRPPDVVRVAPVPLYNRYHDVWRFGRVLEQWRAGRRADATPGAEG